MIGASGVYRYRFSLIAFKLSLSDLFKYFKIYINLFATGNDVEYIINYI